MIMKFYYFKFYWDLQETLLCIYIYIYIYIFLTLYILNIRTKLVSTFTTWYLQLDLRQNGTVRKIAMTKIETETK